MITYRNFMCIMHRHILMPLSERKRERERKKFQSNNRQITEKAFISWDKSLILRRGDVCLDIGRKWTCFFLFSKCKVGGKNVCGPHHMLFFEVPFEYTSLFSAAVTCIIIKVALAFLSHLLSLPIFIFWRSIHFGW